MHKSLSTALILAAALSAPNLAAAEPAPPNAILYADCFADAGQHRTIDRDGRYLHFACYGEPARSFFGKLGAREPSRAYEQTINGRVYRWTQKPVKDTKGLDHCWKVQTPKDGEAPYGCLLIFPAGAFLDG